MRDRPALKIVARLTVTWLLLAYFILPVSAQPPLFEPSEGYYKAKGSRVTVAWSVDRTELTEDDSLIATLTIHGATNPQEIVRPDLRKIPAFKDQFRVIEDIGDGERTAKEVRFSYRLRPRVQEKNRLPSLDFFYLKPGVGDKPFENARAKGIDLTVTRAAPKPHAKPQPLPMSEPDALFEITTGPSVLGQQPFVAGAWAWLGLVIGGPVVAWLGFVVWRRINPDAARQAMIRRSRAARRALEAIAISHKQADPAATIASAVLNYLRHRYPLPAGADTPSEVEVGLRSAGVTPAHCEAAADFFRLCDESRFTPECDNVVSLRTEASALIARLEAVA